MRLLLDTQAWLWMVSAPERMDAEARSAVEDPSTELWLSSAAVWEMAIKISLGKLRLAGDLTQVVPRWLDRTGVPVLDVGVRHALTAAQLPTHHRDPFDRMMVAQAQAEGLAILTADTRLRAYDVEILRA